MISKILVPVDGSTHASAAVDWASDLAIKYQARLILLHVRTERGSSAVPEELRAYAAAEKIDITDADLVQSVANRIVNVAEQRARSRGAKAVEAVVEFGNPAKIILERARGAGVDLIVMGRRGLGALPGMLLGSVSGKILHLADCACLTVK